MKHRMQYGPFFSCSFLLLEILHENMLLLLHVHVISQGFSLL